LQEAAATRAAESEAAASFLRGLVLSVDAHGAQPEIDALAALGKSAAEKLRTARLGMGVGVAVLSATTTETEFAFAFEQHVVTELGVRVMRAHADVAHTIAAGGTADALRKQRSAARELEAFVVAVTAVRVDREFLPSSRFSCLQPHRDALMAHVTKHTRAAKAHALDTSVQNGRQLGIKITMNSVYGFTGVSADKGLLPCKPVAAVTTLKGRAFIGVAKDFAESTYEGARVIYGDTDSIMIYWGRDISIEEAYALGGQAATAITALLRSGTVEGLGGAGYEAKRLAAGATDPGDCDDQDQDEDEDEIGTKRKRSPARDLDDARKAIDLTNEKVYHPYLLDKKKRYGGLCVTMDDETGTFKVKLDMKGIDSVRRDRPGYVRSTCEAVLRALLYDRSVEKARAHVETALESILVSSGRGSVSAASVSGIAVAIAAKPMPISAFVMSKSVRGSYKNGVENLPQVQAWRRMQTRGDDDIPPIGARMPYVVVAPARGIAGGTKSRVKLFERSEHPSHVKATGLPLDIVYYLEQLQKPVTKLVQHVGMTGLDDLFANTISRAHARVMGLRSLSRFFDTGTPAVGAPKPTPIPRAIMRVGVVATSGHRFKQAQTRALVPVSAPGVFESWKQPHSQANAMHPAPAPAPASAPAPVAAKKASTTAKLHRVQRSMTDMLDSI
jgi:hypothetical protein